MFLIVLVALILQALVLNYVVAAEEKVALSREKLELIGRFTNDYKADWPGSAVAVNLKATSSMGEVSISFNNCEGSCLFYIGVQVNCKDYGKFPITQNNSTIKLRLDTTIGENYYVRFKKLTEAYNGNAVGTMEVGSVFVDNMEAGIKPKTDACASRSSKLLIFGDSVSAAYGVEGVYPCTFSADTENIDYSYATLVANNVNADVHIVAWSGKGVVRNYGDSNSTSANPLPYYYNRTLATATTLDNYWVPTNYIPDTILVMLGSNDYSTEPNPSDEQFTSGLIDFLNLIKSDYPYAQVGALCSPSASGNQCKNIQFSASKTNTYYVQIDHSNYDPGYGCDMHPNKESQANIAEVVTPLVKEMLFNGK